MATRITICCAEDSLFSGDTAGYDVERSLRHYAELVIAAVHQYYPEAIVETTFEPQNWSCQVATDGDDEEDIQQHVESLCSGEYELGHWAIASQEAAS